MTLPALMIGACLLGILIAEYCHRKDMKRITDDRKLRLDTFNENIEWLESTQDQPMTSQERKDLWEMMPW